MAIQPAKIKARWERVAQPSAPVPGAPLGAIGVGAHNSAAWLAVDEEDEILATVSGDGQLWTASVMFTGAQNNNRHGSFVSESAAKRRVQKWFPAHEFQTPNTAWVNAGGP